MEKPLSTRFLPKFPHNILVGFSTPMRFRDASLFNERPWLIEFPGIWGELRTIIIGRICAKLLWVMFTLDSVYSGCDRTCTGQTGHLLGTGLKGHRGSVRRHDTNSYLALHRMDTGHTFNCQDTRILGSANS